MKFIKKHYKLIITIIVILLIFLIFKLNNKNNQNYTSLGDGYSLGKNSYGQIDYGYSDYFKDYLSTNNYLNRYIKSFSVETMTINSLIDNISINKKIVLNNKEYKLFKSPTEGNIIVALTNVSWTPNETLGRAIYSFSSTAYEVAENTIENIKKYGISDVGSYSNVGENEYKYVVGQEAGYFTSD